MQSDKRFAKMKVYDSKIRKVYRKFGGTESRALSLVLSGSSIRCPCCLQVKSLTKVMNLSSVKNVYEM